MQDIAKQSNAKQSNAMYCTAIQGNAKQCKAMQRTEDTVACANSLSFSAKQYEAMQSKATQSNPKHIAKHSNACKSKQ